MSYASAGTSSERTSTVSSSTPEGHDERQLHQEHDGDDPQRGERGGKHHAFSSPATTALIDRLDQSGHVVRERLGSDRRQVQLRMTPKAFQDGGAMFMPLSRRMGTAMAEFSPEELELVTRFMTAMVEATIAARQEASNGGPAQSPPPRPTK